MRRVSIQEAMPGMVLAKPVTNSSGVVAVAVGLTLDEALIERLEQMGKQAIYVEGEAQDVTISLEECERDLDRRFRKVEQDARQMKIREAIRRHLKARAGSAP